ncbi:MAG: hypothetical protein Q9181_004332 [Wetmoreana brouardii]
MDLVAGVRKEGSRGGRDAFKWEDIKDNQHRENYLGHSLMAPVGRWQKNRDLSWYAKGDASQAATDAANARAEEIKRIKEAEQDALSEALGFPVQPRLKDAQIAGQKEVQKALKETADGDEEGGKGVGFGGFAGANAQQGDNEEILRGHGGETGGLSGGHAKVEERGHRRRRSRSPRRGGEAYLCLSTELLTLFRLATLLKMLPAALMYSYESLKRDTNYVSTWLVIAAESLGKEVDKHAATQGSSSTKTKDKGGKQKENPQTPEKNHSGSKAKGPAVISVNELVTLAKTLLVTDKAIYIPRSIIDAAKSSVAARSRCSDWLAQQSGEQPDLEESNQTHAYFNKALKDVLDILLQVRERQRLIEDSRESSDMSENRRRKVSYSDLEMEDLTMDDPQNDGNHGQEKVAVDDSTGAPLPISIPAGSGTTPDYHLQDPANEWHIAVDCLLTELHSIQAYVTDACIAYKEGRLDNITLAMTANTAVDIAGQAEAKFLESHAKFVGNLRFLDDFEDEIRKARGLEPKVEGAVHVDSVGQFVFSIARLALENFYSSCRHEPPRRSEPRGPPPQCKQAASDLDLLRCMMPELTFFRVLFPLATGVDFSKTPMLDKFSYIVAEIPRTVRSRQSEHFPLHAIFAAQLFIDIHYILGDSKDRGLQELKIAALRHKRTIEQYKRFATSMYGSEATSDSKTMDGILRTIQDWILGDLVANNKEAMAKQAKASGRSDPTSDIVQLTPFELLENHPWLCGTIRFSLEFMVHDLGLSQWQKYCYGSPLGHIYNAFSQEEGYLAAAWTDMDKVFDMHPSTDFFIGTRPNRGDDYKTQYDMAAGLSVINLAKDRKAKKIVHNGRVTALRESAPICRLFFEHIGSENESLAVRSPLLEATLRIEPRKSPSSMSKASETLRRQRVGGQSLTPTQMLEYTKLSFIEERDQLRFDYIGLHQRCHQLGWDLIGEMDKSNEIHGYRELEWLKKDKIEHGIRNTAWFVLLCFQKDHERSHAPMLQATFNLLNVMIKAKGNAECIKLDTDSQFAACLAEKAMQASPASTHGKFKEQSKEQSKEEKKTTTPAAQPEGSVQKRMAKGLAGLY